MNVILYDTEEFVLTSSNSHESIYIDRIKWNVFLTMRHSSIDNTFFQHMLLLNQKLISYEMVHKCILMDIRIYDTDPFFLEFKRFFSDSS